MWYRGKKSLQLWTHPSLACGRDYKLVLILKLNYKSTDLSRDKRWAIAKKKFTYNTAMKSLGVQLFDRNLYR